MNNTYTYSVQTVYTVHAMSREDANSIWERALNGEFSDEVTITSMTAKSDEFYWNDETREWSTSNE